MSNKKNFSDKTKREVYEKWNGMCGFCGESLTIEQHHIVPRSQDPSLINEVDNLILLCSNHHSLTRKFKPNGEECISFKDIDDLIKSDYKDDDKKGFSFDAPQHFKIMLGGNDCVDCPYILIVNNKPLIELWPQKPVHYSGELKFYLYMRFFDEKNNFIGGMFANHWASVAGEEWIITSNKQAGISNLEIKHQSKPIFVKFTKSDFLNITGVFYFDFIKIEANDDGLTLATNKFTGCSMMGNGSDKAVAFRISGNRNNARVSIGGLINL